MRECLEIYNVDVILNRDFLDTLVETGRQCVEGFSQGQRIPAVKL